MYRYLCYHCANNWAAYKAIQFTYHLTDGWSITPLLRTYVAYTLLSLLYSLLNEIPVTFKTIFPFLIWSKLRCEPNWALCTWTFRCHRDFFRRLLANNFQHVAVNYQPPVWYSYPITSLPVGFNKNLFPNKIELCNWIRCAFLTDFMNPATIF